MSAGTHTLTPTQYLTQTTGTTQVWAGQTPPRNDWMSGDHHPSYPGETYQLQAALGKGGRAHGFDGHIVGAVGHRDPGVGALHSQHPTFNVLQSCAHEASRQVGWSETNRRATSIVDR